MALRWSWKNKMGEMTVVQKDDDDKKDVNFKVNIYSGNCLAVFIYEYKQDGKDMYQLYTFFVDTQHVKRMMKDDPAIFWNKVKSIKLNMYYKECETLLRLFTRAGYKVTAYYKEVKDEA